MTEFEFSPNAIARDVRTGDVLIDGDGARCTVYGVEIMGRDVEITIDMADVPAILDLETPVMIENWSGTVR